MKLLLERGADVNVQAGQYGTALLAASFFNCEVIVMLLLDKGADVNVQAGQYGTALQAALYGGHEEIVKLLLENGAEVHAKDNNLEMDDCSNPSTVSTDSLYKFTVE